MGAKLDIRKVFFVSKLALAVLLVWAAVKTVVVLQHSRDTFAPRSATATDNVTEVGAANPTDTLANDYSHIIRRNIFESADSSPEANGSLWDEGASHLARSAEEELGLILLGTISGNPAVARALIRDAKTNQIGLYRKGEDVGGACVESIESNAVILLSDGQRKILRLGAANIRGGGSGQQPSSPSSNQIKTVVPIKRVPDRVQTNVERVQAILGKAVITPYAVDGRVEGLRVTGLEHAPEAADLGLKNGDVIRTVNGQRLTSKQHAYQVFKKARTQPSISVELMRNGKTKQLSFTLR